MITISYAATNDGRVRSSDNNYNTALQGNGTLNVDTTGATLGTFGQTTAYSIFQYFLEFGYTLDADHSIIDAYMAFTVAFQGDSQINRSLELREHNWGATVETFNFRTPGQLASYPLLGSVTTVEESAVKSVLRVGSEALRERLQTTGTLKLVASTSRNRLSDAPFADETTNVYTANESGTTRDPHLVLTGLRKSLLSRTLNSQIQLSDGTHVYAESSQANVLTQATAIKHRNAAGVVTTLYTNNEGSQRIGAQCYALVADAADNIFYLSTSGNSNTLNIRGFSKGSGHTWTATGGHTAAMPQYATYTNQVVAAWHGVGGVYGTIVAIVGHLSAYTGVVNNYALINVDAILLGTGSLLRDSGSAGDVGLIYNSNPPETYNNNFPNAHGSQLDIDKAPSSSTKGQIVSAALNSTLTTPNYVSVARYTLNSNGTGFTDVQSTNRSDTVIAKITKDANGKCRVIGTSLNSYVIVVADATTGAGITVVHLSTSQTQILPLDYVQLAPSSIPSLPSEATLSRANNWDVVYHEADNKIWLYYFDVANGRRLMRTSMNLTTGLADNVALEVNAAVGPVGSANRALRVHRGKTVGTPVLISVANENAGAHSMIYLTDTLNLAPTAPTLTTKNNFDATGSAVFAWTFTDPDPADDQTAYQLQIVRVSDSVTVYDSTKITSSTKSHTVPAATLTNGVSYQWRVMTWDRLNVASPWSNYGSFSTSATGNVTITDPATDNPAGANTDQYVVVWSVTGSTQAAYRVEVDRTDTGALVYSSGWVTSTATSHLITGMISGVEHRIEVTVRDSALVESSTATRLITPVFKSPEKPTITVVAEPNDARIKIEVFNPEPPVASGALNTNSGFEGSTTGWSGISGGTLSHSTAQKLEGTGSGLLTPSGTDATPRLRTAVANAVPVTVGQTYRVTAWVYAPASAITVSAGITWQNSTPATISTIEGAVVSVPVGAWTKVEVTADAPVNAATALVEVKMTNTPAATATMHVDAAELFIPSDVLQVNENWVYRRRAGTEDTWDKIAIIGIDGMHLDYDTASKLSYEYQVAGVSFTGFTLSDIVTESVNFKGLWLHDPSDVEGTLRQWPYGRAKAANQVTVASGTHHYAGREFPVIDYGLAREDVLTVDVDIPRGDNWEWRTEVDALTEFALLRRSVMLRDNRGRVLHGAITNYQVSDQLWGSTASFSFTRLDELEDTVI